MDGMPAAQYLRCLERVKEVLVADGAVALHRVGHAGMIIPQLHRVARSACLAMKEVFAAAHTADATLLTVKLLLALVIIVQVANGAKISAKALSCAAEILDVREEKRPFAVSNEIAERAILQSRAVHYRS